jgi:hypothetical protein
MDRASLLFAAEADAGEAILLYYKVDCARGVLQEVAHTKRECPALPTQDCDHLLFARRTALQEARQLRHAVGQCCKPGSWKYGVSSPFRPDRGWSGVQTSTTFIRKPAHGSANRDE